VSDVGLAPAVQRSLFKAILFTMQNDENAGQLISIGTDIIECVRIAQMIEKHGEVFLQRVFTQREIQYCSSRRAATQHYAGRWAAKEAVLKVLGTGWAKGIQWTDVEISNEVSGAPTIALKGKAADVARDRGIREIMISISHCRAYATAFATGVT
jgi:holo-[acyl-carrier protein] synthase